MSLHVETSVQLVWALANAEAHSAGDDQIRPVHLFLGVLKVIDPSFQQMLQESGLPASEQKMLVMQAKQVRQYLEMSTPEVTRLRRSLRTKIRAGKISNKANGLLHRSAEAKKLFAVAADKTEGDGRGSLSILDLVESLFESGALKSAMPKGKSPGSQSEGSKRAPS